MASPATRDCTECSRRPQPRAGNVRASSDREPCRSRTRARAPATGDDAAPRRTARGTVVAAPQRRWPAATVTPLVLLLIALVLLYICVARLTRGERTALGITNEAIVSADDSAVGAPTLHSTRYGLVGRPDQLVRVGRMLIPVEQKPSARRIHQSHVLQLAAQCLLVHEVYGIRPPYG